MSGPSPPSGRKSWKDAARRVPWNRLGMLLAVVTVGFSQIVFNVILGNLDFFPNGAWFFGSVIVYVQILPFAALVLIETALVRWTGERRTFRIWRSVLYTALFLSLLRQVQVYYPDPFWALMGWVPVVPALLALTALVFLLAFRFHRSLHSYFAWLGVLSLVLTASFFGSSDAFGRSWRDAAGRPEHTPDEGLPSVLMIVFDELSYGVLEKNGAIDGERFPNFAALAADSAWFTNATANHLLTTEAFPTLLSGYLFPPHDAPTLFDRLPAGYQIHLRLGSGVSYSWIRKHARENHRYRVNSWTEEIIRGPFEVPRFLAITLDQTPFTRSPFAPLPALRLVPPALWLGNEYTSNLRQDVRDFLEDISPPSEGPRMLFWHSMIAHFPFNYDAHGNVHSRPNASFRSAPGSPDSVLKSSAARAGTPAPDEYRAEAVYENYRDQVCFVDAVLGRVVARMKREGLYDSTLLIVTSDHGLRTWGELEPSGYPEAMGDHTPRIPLFIRGPGVRPGRLDVDVQQVDLIATLLDVLGCSGQADDTEGVSAFAADRPERQKVFVDSFLGRKPRRYVYDADARLWRWIRKE